MRGLPGKRFCEGSEATREHSQQARAGERLAPIIDALFRFKDADIVKDFWVAFFARRSWKLPPCLGDPRGMHL